MLLFAQRPLSPFPSSLHILSANPISNSSSLRISKPDICYLSNIFSSVMTSNDTSVIILCKSITYFAAIPRLYWTVALYTGCIKDKKEGKKKNYPLNNPFNVGYLLFFLFIVATASTALNIVINTIIPIGVSAGTRSGIGLPPAPNSLPPKPVASVSFT